jgi:hypothetical protein
MLFRMPLVMVAAVLLSAAAVAQITPAVGDDAPASLGGATWIANAPAVYEPAQLKGSVIFIEHWGIR